MLSKKKYVVESILEEFQESEIRKQLDEEPEKSKTQEQFDEETEMSETREQLDEEIEESKTQKIDEKNKDQFENEFSKLPENEFSKFFIFSSDDAISLTEGLIIKLKLNQKPKNFGLCYEYKLNDFIQINKESTKVICLIHEAFAAN